MVYYIRFFKTPRIVLSQDGRSRSISAVVTIQNDLGDIFLQSPIQLLVQLLIVDQKQNEKPYKEHFLDWSGESQSLVIQFTTVSPGQRFKLLVSEGTSSPDPAPIVPRIISAWSAPFGVGHEIAEASIERRFLLPGKRHKLRIWEETGNSIACHIWDAAIGLILLFQNLCGASTKDHLMPILGAHLNLPKSTLLQAVELGSGCGIVGLCLMHLFPHSNIALTDLHEAREILERNISANGKACPPSSFTYRKLAWGDDPEVVELGDLSHLHLILASDCTYNPSSSPALVQTFASIVRRSQVPKAFILVAMKRRHESEAVFFDLMCEARFVLAESAKLALPNLNDGPHVAETVEFFLFGWHGQPDAS